MASALVAINKISEALLSFYSENQEKQSLLDQTEKLIEFLEKEEDILAFFAEYGLDRDHKKEALKVMCEKFSIDELFSNTLNILIDKNLIFHLSLFLSTIKSTINKVLNVQNVFVYSSFPIIQEQKDRLEKLWSKKVYRKCLFHYLIDESLGLGLKVQMDTYIEEFSLSSNMARLKLQLDSVFG
ncbi:hypothetical protein A6V39_04785 [Candidatus Mycoplasma haematobovis]|uniref:ATP synthase subunit delta n=1 Tax=Candidatus Mycoplasma haematobovis TaxID=432608 RepID=A0A1A9QD30_9MOLU|nr:F0F1 ATP synthase subunit delta [Candidatus Mycoplasma haematobovis]OAL09865.1 hypothetical protein A6V39_04785 [Candidatus Mycoplasma haematobovis]